MQDFSCFCRTPPVFSKHTSNLYWPCTSNTLNYSILYQNARHKLCRTLSRICRTAGYLRQKSRTVLQKAGRLATMHYSQTKRHNIQHYEHRRRNQGGRRGHGPPQISKYMLSPPPPDFKTRINQHWLEITFKHVLQFLKCNLR